MEGMFGDSGFKYLDLSNFNTKKVQNMHKMFGYCHFLTSIELGSFDTSSQEFSIYVWAF